jgi:uncharacterized protein (DUF736 family)
MIELGRFRRTDTGYAGALKTLTLEKELRIEPAPQTSEKSPDHRLFSGEAECGAAWTPDEDNGTVLSLKIEDPALAAPIRARLVKGRDEDDFVLLWRRSPGD